MALLKTLTKRLTKRLLGIDTRNAASNAVLGNHLIETCSLNLASLIVSSIGEIQMSVNMGATIQDAIDRINAESRIVQTNLIAIACGSLRLPPNIPGHMFYAVGNPFDTGSRTTEEHINAAYAAIRRKFALVTPWPGNSQSINLLDLL